MYGLVLLVATWNCWISYKKGYGYLSLSLSRSLDLDLSLDLSRSLSLDPLAHRRSVASLVFSIGITLVDVHLSWLNWFHFLILDRGILVILIDCVIFLSPFLDVTRMSYLKLDTNLIAISGVTGVGLEIIPLL